MLSAADVFIFGSTIRVLKEIRIVTRKVPGINERLAREISRFMEVARTIRLAKAPGVAETLDWAQALCSLHADHLDLNLINETLACVVKDADDIKRLKRNSPMAGSSGSSRQRPASQMVAPRDLMRAMLAFGAMLRFNGLTVTTGALMDSMRAFEIIDLLDRHGDLSGVACASRKRPSSNALFDRCFDVFWRVGTGYGANFEQSAAEA